MKLTTFISILDVLESKIVRYTKSALFWLSFASLILVSLPFNWWYMLLIILYNIFYTLIAAYFVVKYDDDILYYRYDPSGKLKKRIREKLNKKAP